MSYRFCDLDIDTKNLTILDFVIVGIIIFVCATIATLLIAPINKLLVREVYSSQPGRYLNQKQRETIMLWTLPACTLGIVFCELFLRKHHPIAFCVTTFMIGYYGLMYLFMLFARFIGAM